MAEGCPDSPVSDQNANSSPPDTLDRNTTMNSVNAQNQPKELTLGHKMVSALSGSVLTSLLVTPLDVVRIRLQSQQVSIPAPSSPHPIKSLRGFPAFTEIPADFGMNCCQQVFFVSSSPSNCLLGANMMVIQNPIPSQAMKPLSAASSNFSCAAEEIRHRQFTSTLDALFKIARNEGPRTLWRGLTPTLIMAVPSNVIYYSGYDWLRTNPSSPFNKYPYISDTYTPLVAGSSARILAAMTISPIEMFRTRLQATPSSTLESRPGPSPVMETLRGMRAMVHTSGIFSLWRGLTLTLWRDAPFSAIYWFGYESFRSQLLLRRRVKSAEPDFPAPSLASTLAMRQRQNTTDTLIDSFAAGALAGSIASIITQPFDVGKTRKQVTTIPSPPAAGGASVSAASLARHTLPEELPMLKFIWHIFQTRGLGGLFQGGVARVLKVAPSCAIMISTYEIGKKIVAGLNEDEL